jgi:hypothetical protein
MPVISGLHHLGSFVVLHHLGVRAVEKTQTDELTRNGDAHVNLQLQWSKRLISNNS